MNEIRKKICIDKIRSHHCGVMPYIRFGESNPTATFVDEEDNNGNWSHFPYDFAKVCTWLYKDRVITEICTSGITEDDHSIEARLRYCDLVRKYNYVESQLRNGIYCKSIKQKKVEVLSTDCEDNTYGCGDDNNRTTSGVVTTLISRFDNTKIKYDFIPMKNSWFEKTGEYTYQLRDLDELYETEPQDLVDWIYHMLELDENYIVLLSDFDTVRKYEEEWPAWWYNWFGSNWDDLFPNHEYSEYFQFSLDFEKYCLGKICVPEEFEFNGTTYEITGIYVPDYVNYSEVPGLISWFEANNLPEKDKAQQELWDSMGGDAFYLFLQHVQTYWIDEIPECTKPDEKPQCLMTYLPPYFSIPLYLEQPYEYELMYENYTPDGEYKPFSAVGIYSGYAQFDKSHYIELTDSGYVESKLENVKSINSTEVGGVVGVWQEFIPTSSSTIFKCQYHSGTSISAGTVISETKYYTDGHFEVTIIEDNSNLETPPNTHTVPQRIWLVERAPLYVPPTETTVPATDPEDIMNGISAITTSTTYIRYSYKWWECETCPGDGLRCADGEIVTAYQGDVYRTIPTLSCIGNLVPNPSDGDAYQFLPTYDNGRANDNPQHSSVMGTRIITFGIPYSSNTYFDMTETVDDPHLYIGNYIPYNGVSIDSGICTIHYVMGGKAGYDNHYNPPFYELPRDTGTHYVEQIPIYQNMQKKIDIDNFVDVDFFYDELDFEATKELVYSDDYRMYRYANIATLEGMEVAAVWTSGTAMTAKLFTKESTSNMLFMPIEIPNIEVDRGNATAFESYFKLGECNSFEDLRQYGNNFFNL